MCWIIAWPPEYSGTEVIPGYRYSSRGYKVSLAFWFRNWETTISTTVAFFISSTERFSFWNSKSRLKTGTVPHLVSANALEVIQYFQFDLSFSEVVAKGSISYDDPSSKRFNMWFAQYLSSFSWRDIEAVLLRITDESVSREKGEQNESNESVGTTRRNITLPLI